MLRHCNFNVKKKYLSIYLSIIVNDLNKINVLTGKNLLKQELTQTYMTFFYLQKTKEDILLKISMEEYINKTTLGPIYLKKTKKTKQIILTPNI